LGGLGALSGGAKPTKVPRGDGIDSIAVFSLFCIWRQTVFHF